MHGSDGTRETLRKMETAHEMWKHLQTIYEPKNDAQQAHTLQALVNYKMNDEQPVGECLSIWQKKLDNVLTSGLEIHSKLQKVLILGALPHSWSTFKTTQNFVNCLAIIDLLANIKQEQIMHSERTPNSTPSIAMCKEPNSSRVEYSEA